jgi:hypothetical protein
MRRPASQLGASGFWQMMWMPREAANAHISSCVSGGVMMATKCGRSRSSISFQLP